MARGEGMKIDAETVAAYAQRYAANLCPADRKWPHSSLFIAPHLPVERLVTISFGTLQASETPLILVDNDATGRSKSGLLVTDSHIHYSLPYIATDERRVKGAFPLADLDMLDFISSAGGVDVQFNSRQAGWLASLAGDELAVLKDFFKKMFRKELARLRDGSQASEPAAGSTVPNQEAPEIIEQLRHFERHEQAFCLNCGYDGLMGVEKRWLPWYMTWWVIFPLLISSVGIVPAIALWWNRASSLRFHVRCPNCNAGLETI